MFATRVLQALRAITMTIFKPGTAAYDFAVERIHRHYDLLGLEGRGVTRAEVR